MSTNNPDILEPLGFLTQDNLNVTERIKKEKTIPFINFEDADKFARQTRSYIYELYSFSNKGLQRKVVFYGWAVPK